MRQDRVIIRIERRIATLLVLLLLVACGGGAGRNKAEARQESEALRPSPRKSHFQPTLPPVDWEPEAQRAFLREHFWDDFDFADTTFLERVDSAQVIQEYVLFVAQVLGPEDGEGMRLLMRRAEGSKAMLAYIHQMAERVLHDPNSPFRSDELYIPVLEAVVSSPYFDEYEKMAPAYDLELVRKNRIGEAAQDFRYTCLDGSSGRLHTLKAPYTLLFFSNPGCPMCRTIQEQITASPRLISLIEQGTLRVLMLYPDADLTEWHKHASEVPASWINARDPECVIQAQRLYDLKAIPSLYLLDSQKRVLLKDVTDVPLIEWRLEQQGL